MSYTTSLPAGTEAASGEQHAGQCVTWLRLEFDLP